MTGTPNQISWAELIKVRVAIDFDRVATLLAARGRPDLVEILEDHRNTVLSNESAGYFIQDWGELNGQVRRLIVSDPRYTAQVPTPPA
jgi:hypothetical protein